MSSDTWSSALPSPVFGELLQEPPDEFDLDIRWGELDRTGSWDAYLPTAREAPGETCDTHAATCPNTCHATCPNTCQGTCPATCQATCPNTCHATCQGTCARTCNEFDSCGGTCAQTHCFTCRADCGRP
jgi:hypothetical protein